MAFTDATDDSVSDSFARLKKASQQPKEPRVELAQAAISTTLSGQLGGLQLQLGLEQQANQAAMNMYSALAKMVA